MKTATENTQTGYFYKNTWINNDQLIFASYGVDVMNYFAS